MNPTKQQLYDTEVALSHWWCGTDFSDIDEDTELLEDHPSFSDDAIVGSKFLQQYEPETIELLTLWRGYLHANSETGVQPTVEDFIIATYVVNKSEHQ